MTIPSATFSLLSFVQEAGLSSKLRHCLYIPEAVPLSVALVAGPPLRPITPRARDWRRSIDQAWVKVATISLFKRTAEWHAAAFGFRHNPANALCLTSTTCLGTCRPLFPRRDFGLDRFLSFTSRCHTNPVASCNLFGAIDTPKPISTAICLDATGAPLHTIACVSAVTPHTPLPKHTVHILNT